jgi:hypothetical protein
MHRMNGSKEGSNLIPELGTIPVCMPHFIQRKRNLLTEASVGSGQRDDLAPSSCRRDELSGLLRFELKENQPIRSECLKSHQVLVTALRCIGDYSLYENQSFNRLQRSFDLPLVRDIQKSLSSDASRISYRTIRYMQRHVGFHEYTNCSRVS